MITTINEFRNKLNENIYTIDKAESEYKYFHLSYKKLLNNDGTFIFTAKVPNNPYQNNNSVIEDDFTARVSLSNSIDNCLKGVDDSTRLFYVYGVDLYNDKTDDIDIINIKQQQQKCPNSINNKYGVKFDLNVWISSLEKDEIKEIRKSLKLNIFNKLNVKRPSDLPEKYKKKFYSCVPDADISNELWSLKDLKMDYLGILNIKERTIE